MLYNIPVTLKDNDFLLILNRKDEIIAIAQSKCNYENAEKAQHQEIIALNLSDKGIYLRVEQ